MFLTREYMYELVCSSPNSLLLVTKKSQSGSTVTKLQFQVTSVPRSETLKLVGALQKFCQDHPDAIENFKKNSPSNRASEALQEILNTTWTNTGFPRSKISQLHRHVQTVILDFRTLLSELYRSQHRTARNKVQHHHHHSTQETQSPSKKAAPKISARTDSRSTSLLICESKPATGVLEPITLIDFRTCTHLQNLLPLITRSVLSPTETLAPLPKTTPRLLRLTPSGNNTVVLENVRTHKIAVRQVRLEPNVHGTAESMSTTEIMDLATHLVLNAEAHNSVPAFEPYRSLLSDLLFCREKSLLLEPDVYVFDSEPNTDVRMVAAVVQAFLADWFESPK